MKQHKKIVPNGDDNLNFRLTYTKLLTDDRLDATIKDELAYYRITNVPNLSNIKIRIRDSTSKTKPWR